MIDEQNTLTDGQGVLTDDPKKKSSLKGKLSTKS